MKFVRALQFLGAIAFSLLLAGLLKEGRVAAQNNAAAQNAAAQNDQAAANESVVSLQLAAVDQIAADDVTEHHVHIHPQRGRSKAQFSPSEHGENTPGGEDSRGEVRGRPQEGERGPGGAASVPGVPGPGFYPADLSNPSHGKVLTAAQSNNLYVNCAASCWGNPAAFLNRLATSNFMHMADEYVGTTATNRYTVGASSSINDSALPKKLNANNILQIVHAGARLHGSGYDHVYHVFLRSGVDVCVSSTQCYSPDNPATFVFCAFHASVDFKDIGHVLYSVEPFQNVPGCAVAQPSPNGPVVDSTASTLSHELIEAITDPDGTAWVARNSLIEYGAEVADICETPFGNYAAVAISGKSYAIQPEYSNRFHACATTP